MIGQTLHFFAGKGGVGKTTLASAFAIGLSERAPEEKILLISTDSARALSDLLKKNLSGKATKVLTARGEGGVFAAEFDPSASLESFAKEFRPALDQVVGRGKLLTEEDLRALLAHLPVGTDELLGLFELMSYLESGSFDRIVVDLAASNQTLHLLERPHNLKKFLAVARAAERATGKAKKPPLPEGFLDELSAKIDRLAALLKNPSTTAVHLVTLAEPAPEVQTRWLFSELREREMPVTEVLVNQVEDGVGCPACQGRRGLQAPHVRKLQQMDKNVPVYFIARRELPPRGVEGLKALATEWFAGRESKPLEFSPAEGPPALVRAPSMPPIAAPPLHPTRLIFFVGQGGVGKSSCAAAAAVTLTEKEGPVLLISTDPAHSLSEILLSRLTDTESQVKGTKGLYARELDSRAWFNALRKRVKEATDAVFESAGNKGEVAYDREVLKNLFDSAPVDVDDLAALSALSDALIQERFKRIVVDPSPSGEVVRLVQLPDAVRPWLSALLGVLVKYRSKGMGELADLVSLLIKKVKRFEEALLSTNEVRFIVVSRGEELAIPKTERLVQYLQSRKLAVERVLVNRVLPKSTCAKCENRRRNELAAAKIFEKKLGVPLTVAPALGRHPAGLRELKAFRTSWYALSAPAKIKAA
jgi:arsenite/tail-anchored protein-transporting ATPase